MRTVSFADWTRDSDPLRAHMLRFLDNFKFLRRKGTLVSVGNASGPVEPIAPLKLVEKNIALLRPTCVSSLSLFPYPSHTSSPSSSGLGL